MSRKRASRNSGTAQAPARLPVMEQAVGDGGKAQVDGDQHERHAAGPGIGGDLEHAGALPLARGERQPGESAEKPGARPLDEHPGARERQHREQPGRRRAPDQARCRPPDHGVPEPDPGPHERPEQEEAQPGHVMQPPEEDRPGHGLGGEHRPGEEPEGRPAVGPQDRRNRECVRELGRVDRRKRDDREDRREHAHRRPPSNACSRPFHHGGGRLYGS